MPSTRSQNIQVAVDSIIFTVRQGQLMVLLIQMKKKPYTGLWAFPGGLIEPREMTATAARRILLTQTGLSDVYLEQLATFDDPKRDLLGRVMSVAYFALVPSQHVILKTSDKYADVRWWPVEKLPRLAYDHAEIAKVAVQRLRWKVEYTNVVWSLLPLEFTLTELQQVYANILGRKFDKRNFRRKALTLDMLKPSGKIRKGEMHRPAALYQFKERRLKYLDVL